MSESKLGLLQLSWFRSTLCPCLLERTSHHFRKPEDEKLLDEANLVKHVTLLQVELIWRVWVIQTLLTKFLHAKRTLPLDFALFRATCILVPFGALLLLDTGDLLHDQTHLSYVHRWLFSTGVGGHLCILPGCLAFYLISKIQTGVVRIGLTAANRCECPMRHIPVAFVLGRR